MNLKINLLIIVVAATLLSSCYQRIEVTSTPCDALGKTTDPALKAELDKKCGRGGPDFKPSSGKTW